MLHPDPSQSGRCQSGKAELQKRRAERRVFIAQRPVGCRVSRRRQLHEYLIDIDIDTDLPPGPHSASGLREVSERQLPTLNPEEP